MKKKLLVYGFAMLSTTAAFSQAGQLDVCAESVSYKGAYGDQTSRELKGICHPGASGAAKWVVKPQFVDLHYTKTDRLFYGWKFNNELPGEEFKSSMEKYGATSSVVFNAEGSKRFEVAGKLVAFNNGYGQLLTGRELTVLGMTTQDIQRSGVRQTVVQGVVGIDYVLSMLGDFFQDAFMLDKKVYRTIAENHDASQKMGFIDEHGNVVVEPRFKPSYSGDGFDPNYAIVGTESGFGLIDKKGNFVLEPKYYNMHYVNLGRDAARWAPKEIVGRSTILAKGRECGWWKCAVKHEWLDPKTLQPVYADQGEVYKSRLLRTLTDDAKRLDGAGMERLSMAAWLVGGMFFWPFCFLYQKIKKRATTGKAIAKGFAWGIALSISAIAATVFALFAFVAIFFGANIFGVVMSQND